MPTFLFEKGFAADGAVPQVDNVSITSTLRFTFAQAVATATVDGPIRIAFKHTALKAFRLRSDQPVDLYTNDIHSGSPANHFVLLAAAPQSWDNASGLVSPITADITVMYIGNASGNTANVDFEFLVDGTI